MRTPEQRNFADVRKLLTDPSITIIFNEKAGIYKKNPIRALKFRHEMHSLEALGNPELFDLHMELRPTRNATHAVDEVGRAIAKGRGAIAVVGGDGTVSPIAHRLAMEGNSPKPDLIALGGGTQNIFQHELTTKKDPFKAALDLLQNGEQISMDVGVIENNSQEYPFVANAGLGIDARVLDRWIKAGKHNRLQVFPIFWNERNKFDPYNLQVIDAQQGIDKTYDNIIAMPIINSGKYGGFFKVTDSDMTDGVLEAVALPSHLKNTKDFIHMLPKVLFSGKPVNDAHYNEITRAVIRETRGEELIFQHDGEPKSADSSEVVVTTYPQAVTVWAA